MQQRRKNAAPTLRQAWKDYQLSRRTLKQSSKADYTSRLNTCFPDWLDLPVSSITKDMVEKRHRDISIGNGPRGTGEALANVAMRVLKAIINYSISKYELPITNPVNRLSEVRAWNCVSPRRGYIDQGHMPAWFAAVNSLTNTTIRDYLLLLIYCGFRRSECALLLWENVDLDNGFIRIVGTKNGDDHILPLSSQAWDVLRKREKLGPYVFQGRDQQTHISLTSKETRHVVRKTGRPFMLHDLRRTFCSIADLMNIDHYTIKRLVNHRTKNDVTSQYIIASPEKLRVPMQIIADEITRQTNARTNDAN